MRIGRSTPLYTTNIYNERNSVKNVKSSDEKESSKRSNFFNEKIVAQDNLQPFGKVYNNANINYQLDMDNDENEKTDDEINLELDRKIYDKLGFEDRGIQFNSPEFRKWMQDNSKSFVIPLNAPAKIRKSLTDMFDSISDNDIGFKANVASAIKEGFDKYNPTDKKSFVSAANNIISDFNDYKNLADMCIGKDEQDTAAMNYADKMISFFSEFSNNIKDLIDEDDLEN